MMEFDTQHQLFGDQSEQEGKAIRSALDIDDLGYNG